MTKPHRLGDEKYKKSVLAETDNIHWRTSIFFMSGPKNIVGELR